MKNLQQLEKLESEMGIPFDAPLPVNSFGGESNLTSLNRNVVLSREIRIKSNAGDRIRNYCLYILLFCITCHAVFGKIKNGYEKNINASKESLEILRARLLEDRNMAPVQRRKIQSTIATFVNHISYYGLTESLLDQFKTIAPGLYAEIDTLRDRLDRPVNVYVKFVPAEGTDVKAWGTTYMDQLDNDKDGYQSEYGEFTVSVKVWIVPRALLVLAHELGHVRYQVPNLASYFEFYKRRYDNTPVTNSMGHDIDDPSGKLANHFGRTFQKYYVDFLKMSTEKFKNPLDLLARLKKNLSKNPLSYKAIQATHVAESQLSTAMTSSTDMTWASLKRSLTEHKVFN
jgi:hypothetical protein